MRDSLVAAGAVATLVSAWFALGEWFAFGERPRTAPYDLAATKKCLARSGDVRELRPGEGAFTYPGLGVELPGQVAVELYFAPTVGAAEDSDFVDSDPIPRRRNVLLVNSPGFDDDIGDCLRTRPRSG